MKLGKRLNLIYSALALKAKIRKCFRKEVIWEAIETLI
jgi:hypothetical protein